MKKLLTLVLLSVLALYSCNVHEQQKRYKTISKKTIKVKRDKVKSTNSGSDEFAYWYFIGYADGGSNSLPYYYYSSTPVSDFRNVSWTSGKPTNFNLQEVEEEETEQVDLADLEPSVQTEMETNPTENGVEETTESVETSEGETAGESDGNSSSSSSNGDSSSGDGDGGGGGGDD